MENVSTPELLLYQELGELFYAIAAADKVVHNKEYNVLRQLVEDQWKKQDDYKDQFGTDAVYQISIVFEWFDYEKMDAEECFKSFTDYYDAHRRLFNDDRKELILKTAKTIADSFHGINKSELIMLTKLEILFKKS